MKSISLLAACALLITAVPAMAHGPHEHGAARLDVAVEGASVEISLESPLANALPFEHAPRDAAQRQAVRTMAAALHQAENIFVFPAAAQCRVKSVLLESEALPAALLEAKAVPQTDTARPSREKHSEASPNAVEEQEEHGGHADLDASFTFECARPDALKGMDVRLFSVWPALHELRVQMVSPTGQHAAELTEQAHALTW